jgi:steroid 5-alpha reductase family enzyme
MKAFPLVVAVGVIFLEARTSLAFVVAPCLGSTTCAPKSWPQKWRSQQPVDLTQQRHLLQRPILVGGTEAPTTTGLALQALPMTALGALPLFQKIFLSCFLPPCLGFWKSEYGVSYAYGIATALTSYWIYSSQALLATSHRASWAVWHAGALMFYGVRLCLFLLYRELCTERMKQSVKNIEDKAKKRGNRWKRAPFVVSCAGLYFGLCAPLLITSSSNLATVVQPSRCLLQWTLQGLVALTWVGFLLAALGDVNKSIVKAIKGENHLVTGGIFALCRHPNYSGEMLAWTCNGLIALVAAVASKGVLPVPQLAGYLVASVAGALGLDFVLLSATKGLEKKQKETYGDTESYQKWFDSVWPGFVLPPDKELASSPIVKPQIELMPTEEETGSGI